MAIHINPPQWEKYPMGPPSLQILDVGFKEMVAKTNSSFLHSQNIAQTKDDPATTDEEKERSQDKRLHGKKISFKIKKTASMYRRNQSKMVSIPASKVAELTMKFNGLIVENEPRKRAVKRVSSLKSLDSDKTPRKPSVKMKEVTRKPSVKTKPLFDERVILRRKAILKKTSDKDESVEQIRPNTLSLKEQPTPPPKPGSAGAVRATIEIFERRNSTPSPTVPKPKVPAKPVPEEKTDIVQIINIPPILPQRRCESLYETLNMKKVAEKRSEVENPEIRPNTSFLWSINQDKSPSQDKSPASKDDWKSLYDLVDPRPELPPRASQVKPPLPPKTQLVEEKIYEELNVNYDEDTVSHSYEYCESDKYEEVGKQEKTEDGYEYCASPQEENIYETLPAPLLLPKRQQSEPLPPRPPSRNSYSTQATESNCYESIYNKSVDEGTYESIYNCQRGTDSGDSNRNSLVSSDQQSNSLYGRSSFAGWDDGNPYSGKAPSDLSFSDRSDDWVDITDTEDSSAKILVFRERQKCKKSGWSQQCREQWSKTPKKSMDEICGDNDPDHLYERLSNNFKPEAHAEDDYDSFDSDTDSDVSFTKVNSTDSGLDVGNSQLPEPPNNQIYVFTRLAASAGKHMRKLRRNWSLTKSDITKSLSRMTKRKSRTDMETVGQVDYNKRKSSPEILPVQDSSSEYQDPEAKTRKSFLNKFRRSMSLSSETAQELTTTLENKPKSTFYLTNEINIDGGGEESGADSGASLSPVPKPSRVVIRPQSPPPPVPPPKTKRSTSWYAEVGLFKNSEAVPKRSSTCWYAEVGLYQKSRSTPSSSSAENSGNNTGKNEDFVNQYNSEAYNNMRNESDYSTNYDDYKDTESGTNQELQLRLQDEPLYQFYDAAIAESVCLDGTSDFDSDGYEEVGDNVSESLSSRPSALELISPSKNSVSFSRTLWCEIPEVIQSSVLSTLSLPQKKLQEAKFEMVTSEASYFNSLNVLTQLFIENVESAGILSAEEFEMLFGRVEVVRKCSEKLLYDLERCWQDNILLHGVCDIVQKHAEENFSVYVTYCENQILLDETLRKLKERSNFLDLLKKLESSSTCQSLTLYSFLMLPMQRITRWPLLVDAVLKRLSPQDPEYLVCQYVLTTINKIVGQCNEGARQKERENEMQKIATQLEFAKGVPAISIISEARWLIRSGTVIHMQQRTDEIKLTFGKRFTKSTLKLFLFNDTLLVTKPKSENLYTVIHYCPRNLVELSNTDMLASLPTKETQGRHLLFLTILENQSEKTVEFLLSCNSESDKERWKEAFTSPKSDDPDETLYECWDCPQVTAIHNYIASQPDELALIRGDVINVLRKLVDGWYHGERIRDCQTGWFPANYTTEVANPHVRSRNLKQRYRLLAFTENYIKAK